MESKPTDIELDVQLIARTELAIKVYDGSFTVWIPKSQIVDPLPEEIEDRELHDTFTLIIPEWIAKEKELI